jgi:hypothetical protein
MPFALQIFVARFAKNKVNQANKLEYRSFAQESDVPL